VIVSPSDPHSCVTVSIGGNPVRICTQDAAFCQMLEDRYAGFLEHAAAATLQLTVDLIPPARVVDHEHVRVTLDERQWCIARGDFQASWDPEAGRGTVRQSANPYSIDSALRIIHTLLLAREGGFLLHSSSVVRSGRAFLFSGISGAGKTTISRLAPPDVTLLTDEMSYIRRLDAGYRAYGTPFAGELAKPGENISAPIGALYFLAKGPENRIDSVGIGEATRLLMRNILFFAEDKELVNLVFGSACDFLQAVPSYRLTFVPDARVWELIG
jgi:hypothetical protein